jgi:hypothetical protein
VERLASDGLELQVQAPEFVLLGFLRPCGSYTTEMKRM